MKSRATASALTPDINPPQKNPQSSWQSCLSLCVLCCPLQDEDGDSGLASTPLDQTAMAHPVAERLDTLMSTLLAYIKDMCHQNGKGSRWTPPHWISYAPWFLIDTQMSVTAFWLDVLNEESQSPIETIMFFYLMYFTLTALKHLYTLVLTLMLP